MIKKTKYLIIFLFLLSCGYSPIYQSNNEINLKLDLINYSGDKEVGRKIIKGLEKFKKGENLNIDSMENKFELNKYKNKLEKNMTFKILSDINIYFNIIQNDL